MIKKYKIGSVIGNPYYTSEQKVGKWIDGKTIYRKVIKIENVGKGTTDINVSDLNINEVISMTGRRSCVSSSKEYDFSMPFTDNGSYGYYFLFHENIVSIILNTSISNNTIVLYLEYTKNE